MCDLTEDLNFTCTFGTVAACIEFLELVGASSLQVLGSIYSTEKEKVGWEGDCQAIATGLERCLGKALGV